MARSDSPKSNADYVREWRKRHVLIQYVTNERTRSLIKAEAARQGMSMNDYIKRAILNQLKADRSARSEETNTIDEEEE